MWNSCFEKAQFDCTAAKLQNGHPIAGLNIATNNVVAKVTSTAAFSKPGGRQLTELPP